ncbi:MAG: nitrilase-related carbon-nitrogen hydrolase, partial [Christensenellales bacterium]
MKDGFIKVAAATPEIKVADCAFNASSVISLIAEAEAKGAAVIVFPELCLTGGTAGDLFFTDALLSNAEEALL